MLLSATVFSLVLSTPLVSSVSPADHCLEVFPGVATPELPMRRAETWTLWAEQANNPVRFHRQAVKLYECAIEKAKALQKNGQGNRRKYAAIQRQAEAALRQARVRVENNWDTFRNQYPAVWWFLDGNPTIERYDDADMAAIGLAWAGLVGGLEPLKIPRLTVLARCVEVVEVSPGQTRAAMCDLLRGELLQLLSQNPRFQGVSDARAVEILGEDFQPLVAAQDRLPSRQKETALVQTLVKGLGVGELMLLDLRLSDRFHLPAKHEWADVVRVDLSYRVWNQRQRAWVADGRRGSVVADVSTGWWIGLIAIALLFMVSVLFNPTMHLLRGRKPTGKPADDRAVDHGGDGSLRSGKALLVQFGIPLLAFLVGGTVGLMAGMVSEQLVPSWDSPALTPLSMPRVHVLWWPLVHGFVVMVVPTLVTVALMFRFLDEATRRRNQIKVSMGVLVTSAQGGALGALYWPVVTASWVAPEAFGLAFLSPLILGTLSLFACFSLGGLMSALVDPNQASPLGRQVGALVLGTLFLSLLLPVGLFMGAGATGVVPWGLMAVFALALAFAPLGYRLARSPTGRSWSEARQPVEGAVVQGGSVPWVETELDQGLIRILVEAGVVLGEEPGSSLFASESWSAPESWKLPKDHSVYLIRGCYGDGKSRQVAQLSEKLRGAGVDCGVGKGSQALSAQPYGLLNQALKHLELADLESRRTRLEQAQKLKEMAGEGLQALGSIGAILASPKEGGGSEASLASGLIDAMEARLIKGPVVILLDDFHLGDDNSKELLQRVVNGVRSDLVPRLVVFLFEETAEAENVHPGLQLNKERAQRFLQGAKVEIDQERDLDRLLKQWRVSDQMDAYRPGFIVDGLRTLRDLGYLEPHRSKPDRLQLKPHLETYHLEMAQPAAVKRRYEDQFTQLSLEQRQVLLCGSLCGEVFSVKNVAEGLERSQLDVLQILRRIEEEHGLVDDDDDDATFRFVSAEFCRHLEQEELKKLPPPDNGGARAHALETLPKHERPWRELAKQMHYNIAKALSKPLEAELSKGVGGAREPDPVTSSLIAYHAHQAGNRLLELASVHLAWGVIQAADRSAWSMAQRKADRFSRRQHWDFGESRSQARAEWESDLKARRWPPGFEGTEGKALRWRLDLGLAQANSRRGGNQRVLARALLRRLVLDVPGSESDEMAVLRRRALILYLQVSYSERQVSELEEIGEDASEWLDGGKGDESLSKLRAWFLQDSLARQILQFFQIRSQAFLATRQCQSEERVEKMRASLVGYGALNFQLTDGAQEVPVRERRQRLWAQAEVLVAEAETQFKLGGQETPGDFTSARFEFFEDKLKEALVCQIESGNLVDAARNHLSRANLLEKAGRERSDELTQCLDAVDELIRKTGAEKLRSRLENMRAFIAWKAGKQDVAFERAKDALVAACETNTARDIFYASSNLLSFGLASNALRSQLKGLIDEEDSPLSRMFKWSVWRELPDGDDLRQKFISIRPDPTGQELYLIGHAANPDRPGLLALEAMEPDELNASYGRFCRQVLAAQIRAYRGRGGQANRERIRCLSRYLVDHTLKKGVRGDSPIYDAMQANLTETFEEKQADELIAMLGMTKDWRDELPPLSEASRMERLCLEVVDLYAALALNVLQRDGEGVPAEALYGRLLTQARRLLAQWSTGAWGDWDGEEAVAPQNRDDEVRRHRRLLSRVLRETVLILERLTGDGGIGTWGSDVQRWLEEAIHQGHLSEQQVGSLEDLEPDALRQRLCEGLLNYAEVLAQSGEAPVAIAQIDIQRADQTIWKLQKTLEAQGPAAATKASQVRQLVRAAKASYDRAGEVLERHRYQSFRSKLRNTFANISWREAMAQSEQDKLGRSEEFLSAYERAQRAYDMASEWERERDLVYAAITLLRFRIDYLDNLEALIREDARNKFEVRWTETVERFQGEESPAGDLEDASSRLTLSSGSIWQDVVSKGDRLGERLKGKLGEIVRRDPAASSWCNVIRSQVDGGRDLGTMIADTAGGEAVVADWIRELETAD